MNSAVANDMRESTRLFKTLVWPLCSSYLSGGYIVQMEGRPDSTLATAFDVTAGFDWLQVSDCGLRGLATRIQPDARDWRTFTVRMDRDSGAQTEYEKRRLAIHSRQWIYPYITIQAYTASTDGPVLSVGIANTVDVIAYIEDGLHTIRRTSNATFAVCPWDKMNEAGRHVEIITPEATHA